MALTPSGIQAALVIHRRAGGTAFDGPLSKALVSGIAQGVAAWASSVVLTGTAVGTAGAGVITPLTTRLVVPSNPGIMQGALAGVGLAGPLGVALAFTVSGGISQAFTSLAQYVGTSAGVGAGQDISRVTAADPGVLQGLLLTSLSGMMGGTGLLLPQLVAGLAIGISGLLLGGTGTGTVTGPPAPAPASGVTTSVVV